MDWSVSPDTPIARLPSALRPPALLVRNLFPGLAARRKYVYEADGLATAHFCPFLEDRQFEAVYAATADEWYGADIRWRLWLLLSLAREALALPGAYAEFGVYRGGCAYMLLAMGDVPCDRPVFLFDTFAGIPADGLTEKERAVGLAGGLADTSVQHVTSRLAQWQSQVSIVEGDVFETLPSQETGSLAFVHMDMNAAAPTLHALEHVYPRSGSRRDHGVRRLWVERLRGAARSR